MEDIPVSELYQVKINGKEQRVYHTEFFDFVSFLDENDKAEVEVTVNEPFQKAVIRPAAAQIPFEEEGNKISISPVSYTQLDVYNRQQLGIWLGRSRLFLYFL